MEYHALIAISIVVTLMLASELSGVVAAEPDGLIGRWDFDDGTGRNLSGNSNHYRQPGYRAAHGLPYNGPEADVIEAPDGSYILYDSRIWHRAGVNRTKHKRAVLLQVVIPMYIMPKTDTSRPYRHFIQSSMVEELTPLEQKEFKAQ